MKKSLLLIILTLSIILFNCTNNRVSNLESRNKQLQHSVDSLMDLNKKLQIIAEKERKMTDSSVNVALTNAKEALLQRQFADKLNKQLKSK